MPKKSSMYWFTLLGFGAAPRPKPADYAPHVASIYVICAGNAVKVGISADPGQRAKQLQTGQEKTVRVFWAAVLEYSDARQLEAEVHARLKRDTSGHASGEWFYIAPETAVAAIRHQIEMGGYWAKPNAVYGLFREEALS